VVRLEHFPYMGHCPLRQSRRLMSWQVKRAGDRAELDAIHMGHTQYQALFIGKAQRRTYCVQRL
jgi:hypothetical protein